MRLVTRQATIMNYLFEYGQRVLCLRTLIVFCLIVSSLNIGQCVAEEAAAPQSWTVRVLVLNFDPVVPAENRKLRAICGGNDPRELVKAYAADMRESSHQIVTYSVVKWLDIDAFPLKKDGFRYTSETYLACRRGESQWHQPDTADYERMLSDFDAVKLVDYGQVDEVWIFGGPYFGFHESAMAGPKAFYINGGVYDQVEASRRFAVMGFSYERGVAEMMHNLCHRTESTMTKVYGGWKADELTSPWARFAANQKQSGTAAVGSCHYPPNAESDYDYSNERVVKSTAIDWLNYPVLNGQVASVSRETWGGPDYHRNYMKWWFTHLPHKRGTSGDGRLNNWWRYIYHLNDPDVDVP